MTNPIPQGFTSITPHLILDGGVEQIVFYEKAFDAKVVSILPGQNNLLMHAEIKIADAIVMLGSNQWGEKGPKSPKQLGGCSCNVHLYLDDVDKTYQRALDCGAESVMPPEDRFWGDRYSQVKDPSGHVWSIVTHVEDISEQEIIQRGQAWLTEMGGDCS